MGIYTSNNMAFGSRHAAHAAKALRWRVKELLKCRIKKKEKESLLILLCFMSRSALGFEGYFRFKLAMDH